MRWSEELLLREEMRRVLEYFTWHTSWWLARADIRRPELSDSIQEGLSAYAYKQAHMRMTLRVDFENLWRESPVLASMGVGTGDPILDLRAVGGMSLLDRGFTVEFNFIILYSFHFM